MRTSVSSRGLLVMPIAVTAKNLQTTHLFGFTLGTDVNDVGDIEGELETRGPSSRRL
jgi:hypothetical protein